QTYVETSRCTKPNQGPDRSRRKDSVRTTDQRRQGRFRSLHQIQRGATRTMDIDVSNKKMSQDEFDNLVSSQTILAKNFVASQALAAQERAEKLTIETAELAATKIVPLLIAVI